MNFQFIICAYNNEKIIKKCLDSIYKLKKKKRWDFSVCVVDDCSTDKTVDAVWKYHRKIATIKMPKNSGPAACRNQGIKLFGSADYFVFLDSDIRLDKNCLVEIMKEKEKFDIAGPKLLLPDGRINSAGGRLSKSGIGYDSTDTSYESRYPGYTAVGVKVMYICSAAMVIKAEVIEKIGLFDETYFYGNEDTDFGWRANLAGYKVSYIPLAEATHLKSQTVKKDMDMVYYHATKNRVRSMIKNYSLKNLIMYGVIHKILILGDLVLKPHRKAKLCAWGWLFKNLPDHFKERKKVQALRKKKDSELPFSGILPK